jgi:hypothetical protein
MLFNSFEFLLGFLPVTLVVILSPWVVESTGRRRMAGRCVAVLLRLVGPQYAARCSLPLSRLISVFGLALARAVVSASNACAAARCLSPLPPTSHR